jgi:hypothetical protein
MMPRVTMATFTNPGFLCGLSLLALAAMTGVVLTHQGPENEAAAAPTTVTTVAKPVSSVIPTVAGQTTIATTTTAGTTTTTAPADTTPPVLTVDTPLDGATVAAAQLTMSGKTEPDAVITVGVVGAQVAADGSWTASVTLVPGINPLVVRATDQAGNAVSTTIHVILTLPPPTTVPPTTTKPAGARPPATTKAPGATTPAATTTTLPPDGNTN